MNKPSPEEQHPDSDIHKGAVESDRPETPQSSSTPDESLAGQLSHRESDPMIKDNDTDFPEPGPSPEHSGQKN